MNIDQYSKDLRKLINDSTIAEWQHATDKKAFSCSLIENIAHRSSDHIVKEILADVLNNLLTLRAENYFTTYREGEEVLVASEGRFTPAVVVERLSENELRVAVKPETTDNPTREELACEEKILEFHRNRDKVYINMEGTTFSRLKPSH